MAYRKLSIFVAISLAISGAALASPFIEKLTLTPANGAKVGEKVTAQIDFSDAGSQGLCGVELEFGDGRRETFKIKPDTKLPIVVEHVYKKPGTPKVRVDGNRVENAFPCGGQKQIIMYPVSAAAPAAAPAAATANCPADWSLKGKVAKDGSFTCVPAKKTKNAMKPSQSLTCPAGTSYFVKGNTLGCEKE